MSFVQTSHQTQECSFFPRIPLWHPSSSTTFLAAVGFNGQARRFLDRNETWPFICCFSHSLLFCVSTLQPPRWERATPISSAAMTDGASLYPGSVMGTTIAGTWAMKMSDTTAVSTLLPVEFYWLTHELCILMYEFFNAAFSSVSPWTRS